MVTNREKLAGRKCQSLRPESLEDLRDQHNTGSRSRRTKSERENLGRSESSQVVKIRHSLEVVGSTIGLQFEWFPKQELREDTTARASPDMQVG